MGHRRDGAARRRRTSLDMKSRHQKVSHKPERGRQAIGEERHVGSYFPVGFPPTCRLALCASEFEVFGRRRVGWKSHRQW